MSAHSLANASVVSGPLPAVDSVLPNGGAAVDFRHLNVPQPDSFVPYVLTAFPYPRTVRYEDRLEQPIMKRERTGWRRLVIAALLASVIVIAACTTDSPLERYEAQVSVAIADVGKAVRGFSDAAANLDTSLTAGPNATMRSFREETQLATDTIVRARGSIAGIDVPPQAARFHGLVIESLDTAIESFHGYQNCLFDLESSGSVSLCLEASDLFGHAKELLHSAQEEADSLFKGI